MVVEYKVVIERNKKFIDKYLGGKLGLGLLR